MEKSPLWSCETEQTIKRIVAECPVTKFEEGIAKLHEAKTEAVNWLNSLETPL